MPVRDLVLGPPGRPGIPVDAFLSNSTALQAYSPGQSAEGSRGRRRLTRPDLLLGDFDGDERRRGMDGERCLLRSLASSSSEPRTLKCRLEAYRTQVIAALQISEMTTSLPKQEHNM